jgi:hypothetical protein
MKLELSLSEMSGAEKLQAMPALRAGLCRPAPDDTAPEWGVDALAKRERRLAAGQEVVLDWDEAKRRLRQEIHEG